MPNPAALCGVYGFRPTVGRYPGKGMINISTTRDTAGILAENLDDVVLLDSVMASKPATQAISLQGKKFAMPKQFYVISDALQPVVDKWLENFKK